MAMSNDAIHVLVQMFTNEQLDSSGDPKGSAVWSNAQQHINFLFNPNGISGDNPTAAINPLRSTSGVTIDWPQEDGQDVVFPDNYFDWITIVIYILKFEGLWSKPTNSNNANNFFQAMAKRVSSGTLMAEEENETQDIDDGPIESGNAEYY